MKALPASLEIHESHTIEHFLSGLGAAVLLLSLAFGLLLLGAAASPLLKIFGLGLLGACFYLGFLSRTVSQQKIDV